MVYKDPDETTTVFHVFPCPAGVFFDRGKMPRVTEPRDEAMLLYDMMYFTSQAISWSLGRFLAG